MSDHEEQEKVADQAPGVGPAAATVDSPAADQAPPPESVGAGAESAGAAAPTAGDPATAVAEPTPLGATVADAAESSSPAAPETGKDEGVAAPTETAPVAEDFSVETPPPGAEAEVVAEAEVAVEADVAVEAEVAAEAEVAVEEDLPKDWYILKVQVNREDSIRDALLRRIKIQGLEKHFDQIVVPTEDVAEFNKSGKRRIVKRKLYPGYILVHMTITDDTWFLVRETPGVGDFTGSAGRPTPMDSRDVERILRLGATKEEGGGQIRTAIPFSVGARVRVKEGNFQNFEGDVASIDQANGRITVMINIFGRSTPVELDHWQVEAI